jgi:predicted metal-dependent peptidase
VIDTSGSVVSDVEMLGQFMAEIEGLQRVYNADIFMIECDWEVQKTYTLKNRKKPERRLAGGGGTSFVPPYEWLMKNKKSTDVLIYLTDLYGEFPKKEFYRTIWVVKTNGGQHPKPPFGRVVNISKEK